MIDAGGGREIVEVDVEEVAERRVFLLSLDVVFVLVDTSVSSFVEVAIVPVAKRGDT